MPGRNHSSGKLADRVGKSTSAVSGSETNPEPAQIRKCILIVEDDPLNMKLFNDLLESQGYDVLQAADGFTGLDLARARHPDLIIMDIHLPHVSGLTVAF